MIVVKTRISFAVVALASLAACAHSNPAPSAGAAAASVKSKSPIDPSSLATSACRSQKEFTLVIHGGMGYVANADQSAFLLKIASEGRELLEAGHASVDVVQRVVEQLEDSGIFNTGRGGTRTSEGTVELDASIMDGRDIKAGAVASLKDVKNPIRLARAVKDQTKHLLMVGEGASKLADRLGFEKVQPSYFTAPLAMASNEKPHYGTVGAVALDRCGHLAAATSTGGLFGKLPGRVGDSPIIGAGTYANDKTCAVSATGEGEKFIRVGVASRISSILQYTKRDLASAVRESLTMVEAIEGSGALIAIDKRGKIVIDVTTKATVPSVSVTHEKKDAWSRDLASAKK